MNSSLACIDILVKSNISKQCLINFLNEVSSSALRGYLGLAEVYDGNANKKKSDLIEMIVYGCINGNLKNKVVKDISHNRALTILREYKISIKTLNGHRNMGLRKKDIKRYVENKSNEISTVKIPFE